ncbi:EmrB/QacA subfamily drug resistance transporter [Isoptericola sp. CG 20/1183]|uniref:EmrB/QacA subfamily drug resistance transporter n=1 Tax=Isoptericola halotolerans TaxID=300560 RepID=A0ABX5EC11_9MICO|nr:MULTISPECIES: MFS transporter [Isoptericola]PRZ05109.1 EmrB/QacA subfamily drug resistance transporter [Isoptericola halotolerans]PRZ05847.1 EmrB/QacA subfamily drug resistance transporter [Isoptericola sp. CG 20/1183]
MATTSTQRRVLLVAILASFVSFLDGTVVNVALPAIADELGGPGEAGLTLQQWVVDGYLVTLGALILAAGSLSDVYGRRQVLFVGLLGFAATSVLCAVAPTGAVLVVARLLQGVAGALLVPSSLALIISTFEGPAQSRAIGTWTAWTGTAMIVGPFVGGGLVDLVSWRGVFWINVPVVAVTLYLLRGVPPSGATSGRRIDVPGAVLAAVGLGTTVFGLIEQVWPLVGVGLALLVAFVLYERRAPDPMLPMRLFAVRNFAWGNVATAAVYGALAFGGFVLTLFLQQVAGYSATAAGVAQLPITFAMLALSTRFGTLAGRHGARWFMTVGPVVAACGFLLMLTMDADASYVTEVLPGVLVFGLGLAITVAPLTSAILGAVPPSDAGIASAVNNAVSRVAGLVVIAFAGVILGGVLDVESFHRALVVTAVLLVVGGLVSMAGIRDRPRETAPAG